MEPSKKTEHEIIAEAMAKFPKEFGLRGFRGDRFRISASASYCSRWQDADTLQLYTQRLCEDGTWRDFAKGSPSELAREVIA